MNTTSRSVLKSSPLHLSKQRTGSVDPSSTSIKSHPINNNNQILSFYLSHCFHGIIYYYCVKYIIYAFVLNHSTATTKDDSENSSNNLHASSSSNNSIISSLAFYGVYHRTPYNQVIHLIGVPFIIWTMILYGTYLPFTTAPPSTNVTAVVQQPKSSLRTYIPHILLFPRQVQTTHHITWATLWVLLYVMFYSYIDFIGACLYTPFLYIMYVTSVHWSQQDLRKQQQQVKKKDDSMDVQDTTSTTSCHYYWYGTGALLSKAFIVHILSWYIQIHLGHQILEGATPASLVNLGAALTSAPLFAFYEMIWYLGYRLSLQQQVLQQVAIYTEQLCTAGANLRVCTMTSV